MRTPRIKKFAVNFAFAFVFVALADCYSGATQRGGWWHFLWIVAAGVYMGIVEMHLVKRAKE